MPVKRLLSSVSSKSSETSTVEDEDLAYGKTVALSLKAQAKGTGKN